MSCKCFNEYLMPSWNVAQFLKFLGIITLLVYNVENDQTFGKASNRQSSLIFISVLFFSVKLSSLVQLYAFYLFYFYFCNDRMCLAHSQESIIKENFGWVQVYSVLR